MKLAILSLLAAVCQSQEQCVKPRVSSGCPFLARRMLQTDGTCNNLENDLFGATQTPLFRAMHPAYEWEDASTANQGRGSARFISNKAMHQPASKPSATMTSLAWVWGQFLDHDMVRTLDESQSTMDIPVPHDDIFLNANAGRRLLQRGGGDGGSGGGHEGQHHRPRDRQKGGGENGVISFTRSSTLCDSNEPLNNITSFIDGSNVYSADPNTASDIRTFIGGRLATSDSNMLPFDPRTKEDEGGPFFLAGDGRANEHTGLLAMHTLWVREHNRIASALQPVADDCTGLCDERIFQAARTRVMALMQHITYNEYLPALLGPNAMPAYSGYDDTIDSSISNAFGTAAYRFGHSMVNSKLWRLEADMVTPIPAGHLNLIDAFFKPELLSDPQYGGIDPILRGLVQQAAEAVDLEVVDELRSELFNTRDDLCARNVQRSRDHCLPSYQEVREEMGLPPVTRFEDVNRNDRNAGDRLRGAYKHPNDIDLFVGGLAEPHYAGGEVGEVFHWIMRDQFIRLRDGDRFWHEQNREMIAYVDGVTLRDIIARNTDIPLWSMAPNVFLQPHLQQPNTGTSQPTSTDTSTDTSPPSDRQRPPRRPRRTRG